MERSLFFLPEYLSVFPFLFPEKNKHIFVGGKKDPVDTFGFCFPDPGHGVFGFRRRGKFRAVPDREFAGENFFSGRIAQDHKVFPLLCPAGKDSSAVDSHFCPLLFQKTHDLTAGFADHGADSVFPVASPGMEAVFLDEMRGNVEEYGISFCIFLPGQNGDFRLKQDFCTGGFVTAAAAFIVAVFTQVFPERTGGGDPGNGTFDSGIPYPEKIFQ